ncbi:MAG: S-layer homology domain-containing protein, partial [Firmicutes bacterium]|nr:S-layer homology domain-containing protein [Bacillota bacterium]
AWTQIKEPTCTAKGQERRDCANCDKYEVRDVNALGHALKKYSAKAATCTEKGWNAYEECTRCDYTTYKELPAKGHTVVVDKAVSAACEKTGLTEGSHCSVCQTVLKKQEVVSATGHKYGVWTQTKAPTYTEMGEERRDCDNCDYYEVRNIDVLTEEAMPPAGGGGGGLIEEEVMEEPEAIEPIIPEEPIVSENPFDDVKEENYFFEPVMWALNNMVTSGTTADTFSPGATCTRAQTVTFLWNAAGKPEPKTTECPFVDVSPTSYYYKAVLWAVEEGITSGVSANSFGPNKTVTRGQTVTFLWKFAGLPDVKKESKFDDVIKTNYYHDAVVWALEEEITSGTSEVTFSPNQPCTRGQIVTFLYRYIVE